MTKTFFIWNQYSDGLKFGSVEYDAHMLRDKYLNDSITSDGDTIQLNLLYKEARWYENVSEWAVQLTHDLMGHEVYVIETGLIP